MKVLSVFRLCKMFCMIKRVSLMLENCLELLKILIKSLEFAKPLKFIGKKYNKCNKKKIKINNNTKNGNQNCRKKRKKKRNYFSGNKMLMRCKMMIRKLPKRWKMWGRHIRGRIMGGRKILS